MTQSNDSPFQIYKRIAALESSIANLNISISQFNNIVSPEGWISEAFEIMESENNKRFDSIDIRLDSLDAKLDVILQHLTGMDTNDH